MKRSNLFDERRKCVSSDVRNAVSKAARDIDYLFDIAQLYAEKRYKNEDNIKACITGFREGIMYALYHVEEIDNLHKTRNI